VLAPTFGRVTPERRTFAQSEIVIQPKVIRDPEFAKRLISACDGNSLIPPINHGRLTWVQKQLDERFKENVSVETVRKWFAGEVKPRPEKVTLLAILLEVDEGWLSLGIQPDLAPRDQKARNATASGAVNVLAGLIQMSGGHPAFPAEDDERAIAGHIDMYAIIKGAQYAFHVCLAHADGDDYRFAVPTNHRDAFQIGVVMSGPLEVMLLEIPEDLIEAGAKRGSTIDVTLTKAEVKARRITDLSRRI
jgi:hypothetical protein